MRPNAEILYEGEQPYGVANDLVLPKYLRLIATSAYGYCSPRTFDSGHCCYQRARVISSIFFEFENQAFFHAIVMLGQCTRQLSEADGTILKTNGGHRRVATRTRPRDIHTLEVQQGYHVPRHGSLHLCGARRYTCWCGSCVQQNRACSESL